MAGQVGRVLGGRYRLDGRIGNGASAVVYEARDIVLDRLVAVKVLQPALAGDESFLRRFRAEAQAVAGLRHPNIVNVFDWGDDAGPFLVLELLRGGSLRALLDRGNRLTVAQAAAVGLEAARALDYAHRRGLVHRDIKPANLLLDDEGRLCVADFGIARALAEAALTEPGTVIGTARYMSPEQMQAMTVSGKADVYALALVLVELVTGTVPFAADSAEGTRARRVGARLVAPPELGALGPVVEQAGRADPSDRPDASSLAQALERVVRELPAPAPLPLPEMPEMPEVPAGARSRVAGDHTEADGGPATSVLAGERRPGPDDTTPMDLGLPASEVVAPSPASAGSPPPPGRRRRWPLALLAVLLLAAVAATAAIAVASRRVPSHPVPALAGMDLAAARRALAARHLRLRQAPDERDEQVAPGLVLRQVPLPGLPKRAEGSIVTVVLSSGPLPRTVPDLSGMDERAATRALANVQLQSKVTRSTSESVAKGIVIDWQPKGEQARGTEVTVTVSDGPAPRTVPDLAGQGYDAAAAALKNVGLGASRIDAFDDTVPAGQVVSSAPGAGAKVARGSVVKLTVSKGPPLVPDVKGKSVDEATSILGQAGYEVVGVSGRPNRPVMQSVPPAGTPRPKGTTVILVTR
jgi:serine/threonine-protein kinase